MFGQQQNFQPHGFDELSANPTRHTVELMGGGKNAAQKQKRAARKRRDDRDREAAAVSGAVVKTKRKSAAAPSKAVSASIRNLWPSILKTLPSSRKSL